MLEGLEKVKGVYSWFTQKSRLTATGCHLLYFSLMGTEARHGLRS